MSSILTATQTLGGNVVVQISRPDIEATRILAVDKESLPLI
ncbi:MAG: hypothetical protein OXF26_12035 [Alphaproteobacteria bacterium]|nr:hypothetical protein [Alphaproteobacteria bacterium]